MRVLGSTGPLPVRGRAARPPLGLMLPAAPARIVVVDDDPLITDMIVSYLGDQGMHAVGASGRQEMTRRCADFEPDLVILDRRLGDDDGLDLLRDIRSRSDVAVIIITGDQRDEVEPVIGLELGADDYMAKPFGVRELVARVRAVLRRRAAPPPDKPRGRYRFGGWVLDQRQRSLTDPAGAAVALTKGEYGLLMAFVDAPQRPLTREFLLQATRMHEDVFDRSIDLKVLRLRRKLEPEPDAPRMIRTERGVGYVFDPPVERV